MTVFDVLKSCYESCPFNYVQIFPRNRKCIEYTIKEIINGMRNQSKEIKETLNLEAYGYSNEENLNVLKIFTF